MGHDESLNAYEITNLKNAKALAAKMRRWPEYESVKKRGDSLIVKKYGHRPWAELAGHMTISTQVIPCSENN